MKRWNIVFLGTIIMMCLGTVYSWSIFRLHIESIFDVGTTLSGLPYMTSLAFYAFFMLLTGRFLDRHNPKLIITLGALLVSIGWILSSYTTNIYYLTITYGVITGSGVGIAYGPPMAVAARWFPEKKGLAVGLVLVGFGLSPLITAPLARNLIEAHGVMRTFLILGLSFGIIIPILSLPFKYPSYNVSSFKKSSVVKNDMDTNKMVKSKSFRLLYLNFLIGTMIGLTFIGITGNVGVEYLKLPPSSVDLLMPIFAIFNGIGRPVFGWLTDKLPSKKVMQISYGLIFISAVLMLTAVNNIFLFGVAFSIFWFNLGGWLAIAPNTTIKLFGEKHYSRNYGVVFTAYGIGAIIGVMASGILLDIFKDYRFIFFFVMGLCILGFIISQRMKNIEH